LLAIIEQRLPVTDDPAELAKLYWETARVRREQGDVPGALEALEHVRIIDENHVGALALTAEVLLRRGELAEAARALARLAAVQTAPPTNRITAAVAAVDLYERKLHRHDLALDVLLNLHANDLTTLPVRERLARAAAQAHAWPEAVAILEQLMHERPTREGRIEAARLAIAIRIHRMRAPMEALGAIAKLLEEAPSDRETLEALIALCTDDPLVTEDGRHALEGWLVKGRDALIMSLHTTPNNTDGLHLLARVARGLGNADLEQSARSCASALEKIPAERAFGSSPRTHSRPRGSQLSSVGGERVSARARPASLTSFPIQRCLAPGDEGPMADLFAALAPSITAAWGPNLDSLGVHSRRDRVDPRAGLALYREIAELAALFDIGEPNVYVGGQDSDSAWGVHAAKGAPYTLVVGASVSAPLDPNARAQIVSALLALRRPSASAAAFEASAIEAIFRAICNICNVPISSMQATFDPRAESIERRLSKAVTRSQKATLYVLCQAAVASGQTASQWATRAQASTMRVAALASGDARVALRIGLQRRAAHPLESALPHQPNPGAEMRNAADAADAADAAAVQGDPGALDVLRFMLSRPYFDLRRALGWSVES